MFGNYIGDGLKGSNLDQYSSEVQRGVRFHRFIDSYTDSHVLVRDTKKLFYPTQAKYSGVVVDVLFDHFLAKKWSEYSTEPLSEFTTRCYQVIEEHSEVLPERSARFYHYMVRENILEAYKGESGVAMVLRGMDSRTPYPSTMSNSVEDLQPIKANVSQAFNQFFPELIQATQKWRQQN